MMEPPRGVQEEGDDVNASEYMMCHRQSPERKDSEKPWSPDLHTETAQGKKFLRRKKMCCPGRIFTSTTPCT